MDHYWLDIRYSINDQMRRVFVIHIIEYVNGTYTYMLSTGKDWISHMSNCPNQCVWVWMRHGILMMINE